VRAAALLACALLLGACAAQMKKEEQSAKALPENCAIAEADVRVLRSEKAHVAQQIAMGVTAIVPIGLVIGLVTFTEGEKIRVATGEYNRALDQKIAEIQTQCGVK
jgi:hypothetical protein